MSKPPELPRPKDWLGHHQRYWLDGAALMLPVAPASPEELDELLQRVHERLKFFESKLRYGSNWRKYPRRAQRLVLWWWGNLRYVEGWYRGMS